MQQNQLLNKILEYEIWNNTGKAYILSFLILILMLVGLKIFTKIVLKRAKKIIAKTQNDLDDFIFEVLENISGYFYLVTAFFVSIQFLQVPAVLDKFVYYLFMIVLVYQVILTLQKIIDYAIRKFVENKLGKDKDQNKGELENQKQIINFLSQVFKGALWIFGIVLILSNFGINVTSLITGLGIGGVAVALALQSILGDAFSSLSIFIDKPFKVGDFISSGKESGTVKKIGLKTTRIIALDGDELVIPNKDLTESRLHNYKKMQRRRMEIKFGVVYETKPETLERIKQVFQDIIAEIDLAELDWIVLEEFGDFSLNYKAVLYLDTPEYRKAMEIKEQINFEIIKKFKELGIEFAYPTQNVLLSKIEKQ
ncbi:MAG: mechanosensitive ion channel [Candidatus Moranbacteria bacterium]|nr:mechanosensitive ion channel [Candidatus Moranbacteria bacterium]